MFLSVKSNRDIFYSGLVFLVVYILLTIFIMRPVILFDTFWHLQMGKDLLENGLSPWVDHYSIRYLGAEISTVPVLFQMLLYKFVALFGEQHGFYYIKLLYLTLMMLVLWVYFRKIKASAYIVFILLPLVASAISMRIVLRPEIFSYVFVVICLILYLNAQKRFATKEILLICLLLVVWTSYHTPVIGYIIIFGLFFEKAINKVVHKDEDFSWSQWLFWGMLIFVTGFINLNFNGRPLVTQHFLIGMINVMSQGFGQYIQEYNSSYLTHSTNILTHVSWVLSVYVAVWSVIKRQYGFAFIVILLTISSWSTVRLLAVVLLVNMLVLALYLVQFLKSSHFNNLRTPIKNMVYVISVCISLMTFYFLGGKAQEGLYLNENRLDFLDQRYPVQVTDYLKHYQDGGNILNFLGYGGYLIYKLSPEYKVYYDGRSNILYPIEFVKHNAELWADAKKVDDVVERYEIDYVLRENKPRYYALLNKVKDIELSFADDRFMLFTRVGEAQFPLVSTLMVFPNCWESDVFRDRFSLGDFGQEIQKEIELSEELFEDKGYTLKVALEFFKDYLASDDKEAFLNSFYFEEKHTNGIRRIALYIAMKEAGSGTVSKIFSSIGESDDYDLLLYSYYLAKNGYYDAAEQLTYAFYTLNEVGEIQPTYDQLGILWRIFKILKEHNKIQRIEPSYIEVVDTVLKEVHYPFDRELSFDFMCK